MTKLFLFAAALSAGGLASMTAPSLALPFAPAGGPAMSADHVAFGCGPGFRPNEWGRCVPMRRWARPPHDRDRWDDDRWNRGRHRGWDEEGRHGRRGEHRGWDRDDRFDGGGRRWRDDDD